MIRLHSDCIRCLTEKYLKQNISHLSEAEQIDYYQTIFRIMSEADHSHPAPVAMHPINKALAAKFGIVEDFTDIKRIFNDLLLRREEDFLYRLQQSADPLKLAVQYAMIGNYIDFGAIENVTEETLSAFIDGAPQQPVNSDSLADLKSDLEHSKKLVYLTDNCGEIVFDKYLMRTIRTLYPDIEITAIVRGGEVSNDATRTDAEQIRLHEAAHNILDNGNDIAGTWLPSLSDEARAAMTNADVLIAKGQANFETLRRCGLNIHYIFLCKCEMFARQFGVKKFTGMLINDQYV
jgi:uncharacterized protein with ATP-grasp and redox domains